MDYLPLSYSRGPLPHVVNPQRYGAQSNPKVQGTSAPYANPFGTTASAGDSFTPSAQASVVNPAFGSYPQQAFTAQNLTNPFAQHAEETLGDAWANDSLIWGTRALGSYLVDEALKSNDPLAPKEGHLWRALQPETQAKLDKIVENSDHWRSVLKVDNEVIHFGESVGNTDKLFKLNSRKELFSAEGIAKYREVLKHNFGEFLNNPEYKTMTPRSLWKKTLLGGNMSSIIEPFKSGEMLKASTGVLALGAMGYGIVENTAKTWKNSRSQGDGFLTSVFKTGAALAGQTLKAGISWEAGTIGGVFGAAIFSFGAIPAVIGTVVVGGLFGTLAHKALSTIIPDAD